MRLEYGTKGEFVIQLQVALRETGLYKFPINGLFDSSTLIAVKEFQTIAGLTVDGVVGPMTWKALNDKTSVLGSKLMYLMIHCTASREGQEWTKGAIEETHMGPADVPGGVRYKGKTYPNRNALPQEFINNKPIRNIVGRGWSKCGYYKMIHLDGSITVINPVNENAVVEGFEVTFGALGFNNNCRHVVYVGGAEKVNWQIPKDTRTVEQTETLKKEVLDTIGLHPTIKILGHHQVANKACPSFDVPSWLREIGVSEKNIF